MPHKQVLFRSAAREKILSGRDAARRRRARDARPAVEVGADRKEMGRADRLQRRRDHRQGVRSQGSRGEPRCAHAAPGGRETPAIWSATAPAPRPSWRTRSSPTASATSWRAPARSTSSGVSSAATQGGGRARCARCRAGRDAQGEGQVATLSAHNDPHRRRAHRRCHGEGRQRRRDHRRGIQVHRDPARRGRGHAVRPRLHIPYFVTDPQDMEVVLEDALLLSSTRRSHTFAT
jgi:hypothetical protein